jgi:hypothetical protein
LTIIIAGCDDNGPNKVTVDKGIDYFPLRTGLYQIYDIDEIRYSQVAEPETLAYQLITEVVDSFPNAGGGFTYVIYRSTRDDETDVWQFLDTWSARLDEDQAVVIEGNTPYVKLAFPPVSGKTWDGNKLSNLEEDEYEVKAYDVPSTVGGTTFDKTLAVEQEFNDDPIVFTDIRVETYARNIGLINKETTQIVFCQSETCSGNELIESGIILKQQISEYGIR